jgi:hypothetical protein
LAGFLVRKSLLKLRDRHLMDRGHRACSELSEAT